MLEQGIILSLGGFWIREGVGSIESSEAALRHLHCLGLASGRELAELSHFLALSNRHMLRAESWALAALVK